MAMIFGYAFLTLSVNENDSTHFVSVKQQSSATLQTQEHLRTYLLL